MGDLPTEYLSTLDLCIYMSCRILQCFRNAVIYDVNGPAITRKPYPNGWFTHRSLEYSRCAYTHEMSYITVLRQYHHICDGRNMWRCVAVCCSVLQCDVLICMSGRILQCFDNIITFVTDVIFDGVLQCVAVCCSVLQCVAVWYAYIISGRT